jgi:hypothetical protein
MIRWYSRDRGGRERELLPVPKKLEDTARREPQLNGDVDGPLKAIDKLLDKAVVKMLLRGPGNSLTSERPKLGRGRQPNNTRREGRQRQTPVTYILPPWRKKLKDQDSGNVRITKKFHAFEGAGAAHSNSVESAVKGVSSRSIVSCDPHLDTRRDGKRLSEPLTGRSRKKGSSCAKW